MNALVAAVQDKLDAARRLQLARDRWALRAPELRKYWIAISTPVDLFARLQPSLENIKLLAGSSPASLAAIDRAVARIVKTASAIAPPAWKPPKHGLACETLLTMLASKYRMPANSAKRTIASDAAGVRPA